MSTPTEPTQEGAGDDALLGRLVRYVKAPEGDEHAAESLAEATDLVDDKLTTSATYRTVPDPVRARAIVEVAADLYHRRATRLGVAGFADNDLNPVRITRDPHKAAEGILAPYLLGGFG